MKGLKYLFTVPEGVKITDKMLTRVLVANICSILLCMSCLVSTTWAWYTVSIENRGNVIQVGSFDPVVTVLKPDGSSMQRTHITLETYEITEPGDYALNISLPDDKVSGYCLVKLSDGTNTLSYLTPWIPETGFKAVLRVGMETKVVETVDTQQSEPQDPNAAAPAAEEESQENIQEEQTEPQLPAPTTITLEVVPMWGALEEGMTIAYVLDSEQPNEVLKLTEYVESVASEEETTDPTTEPTESEEETTEPTEPEEEPSTPPTESTEPEENPTTPSGEPEA